MKSHSSNEATVSSRWLLAKLIPWHGDARCVIRYSMSGFLVTSPRVKASESLTTALNVWPFVVWLFQLWALNTVIIPVYFVTINHKFGQCLGTYEAPSRLIECLTRIRRYSDHMLKKQLHVFFLRNHPHVHHACGQRNAKHMANKHSRLFGQKHEVINHSTTNHSWPIIHPFVVYTLPNSIIFNP